MKSILEKNSFFYTSLERSMPQITVNEGKFWKLFITAWQSTQDPGLSISMSVCNQRPFVTANQAQMCNICLLEVQVLTEHPVIGLFCGSAVVEIVMQSHSVPEWIWIKGSYLSQWLPQGERGPHKESKSWWIEILHGGSQFILWFLKIKKFQNFSDRSEIFFCFSTHEKLNKSCSLKFFFCSWKKK